MSHPSASTPMDFRFLDLPAEIRLMVYELLPTCIAHNEITIETDNESERLWMKNTKVKLVNIWYPTTVRLVSRIIREEATTTIARASEKNNSTRAAGDATKMSQLSPKIIVPCGDLEAIAQKGGPLQAALEYLAWFLNARKTGSTCVTARPECSALGPDSSITIDWARQAGWCLSQMRPGTRAIYIALDAACEPLLHLLQRTQDVASLLRFEKDAEELWCAQPCDVQFRVCLVPPGFASKHSRRWFSSRGPPGYLVEHVDVRYGEWIKTWIPRDCV